MVFIKLNSFINRFCNFKFTSILVFLLFTQCSFYEDQLENAIKLEQKGEFEAALMEYKLMDDRFKKRFEIRAGLGRLYSLKKSTLFAGLDYLENAYLQKNDKVLWKELMLLYIAMQQYENALKLIQEPYVDLQQLFSPDLIRWRTGLICLHRPNYVNIQNLKKLKTHARRSYFYILCSTKYYKKKNDELLLENWQYLKKESKLIFCELVSVLPVHLKLQNLDLKNNQKKCKIEFLSNVSIQRENLNNIYKNKVQNKILFKQNRFNTSDPGRDDRPPWPSARNFETLN